MIHNSYMKIKSIKTNNFKRSVTAPFEFTQEIVFFEKNILWTKRLLIKMLTTITTIVLLS